MMVNGVMSKLYQAQILNHIQQFKASFQQLGNDLQSGNVSAAQQDFANLTTSGLQSSPASPCMQQLSTDLQSGNLSSAQQDYTALQRALQQHLFSHARATPASSDASSADPLGLLKNLAATAAYAYAGAGIPGLALAKLAG